MTPRLVVTCGDVNGVGLECFLKGALHQPPSAEVSLVVDRQALLDTIHHLHLPVDVGTDHLRAGSTQIGLIDLEHPTPVEFGRMRASAGALAIDALEKAATHVANGHADAVVTLPINKEACHLAGFSWPGQTEFFGARWGGSPIMILAWKTLRVALATVHISLRSVPGSLSIDHLTERIRTLDRALRVDFGLPQPHIAVLGLNPHAGENGTIGRSEIDVIAPAIEEAIASMNSNTLVEGPFPADGFFGFGTYERFDGILAMYHDQGLIPLKLLARGGGVNVTSGLRHVRTSPDHGTAHAIAGTGKANPTSTIEAIALATEIVARRSHPA